MSGDMKLALDRAMKRAKAMSDLDQAYGQTPTSRPSASGTSSSSGSKKGLDSSGIVSCLQGICGDASEKASYFFSNLLTGKSIVLETSGNEAVASTKIQRDFKRKRVGSQRIVKASHGYKARTSSVKVADLNILKSHWLGYLRGFVKSSKGHGQLQSRLSQIELIGAEVEAVESNIAKNIGLRGVIVDHSKNCFYVAKWNAKISGATECKVFRLLKKDVSLAILLPSNTIEDDKNSGDRAIVLHGSSIIR